MQMFSPLCSRSNQAVCHQTPHCFSNGAIKARTLIFLSFVTRSTTYPSDFVCTGPDTLITFTPPLHHRVCSCLRAHMRLCAFVQINYAVFRFVTNPHLLVHPILPSHLCVIQTAPAITPLMVRASFVTYPFKIIISRRTQGESAQTVPAADGGIKWT